MTVKARLSHRPDNIAASSVSPKTLADHRTAVRQHLIPGIGQHSTDRQPEHVEKLYAKIRAKGLKPATVHQVHRTLRTALNEAVRRGKIVRNPARWPERCGRGEGDPAVHHDGGSARPRDDRGSAERGEGWRWLCALGLRQGEALGPHWRDVELERPTLIIWRAVQRLIWQHGCGGTCGRRRGADCPSRHGGGLVVAETKSRSGRRAIGLPAELVADLWQHGGWLFAQPTGKPIDPRADYAEWHAQLKAAGVRPA